MFNVEPNEISTNHVYSEFCFEKKKYTNNGMVTTPVIINM